MAKVELDIRAQITNLNKGLDKTERQLKDLQRQSNKTSKTIQSNMNRTTGAVSRLTAALGALLTIGAVIQFTKAIINVRGEFETFNAVLANTLGSTQAANREFKKLQQFAKETPFSVRELTDSFVRLVNQGFKPTVKQLKLLGDLAASTGKGFIQLTEAIIDAQVGEFERLKEFGIRASKQGNQVTFTFKEIQTQVEFTASAIQGYILSLGDLDGVSGAMIAISKTLTGQLNNLADSWDNLLDILGEKSGGVFNFVIRQLGAVLNILGEYNELQQGITENSKEFTAQFIEGLEGLSVEEKIRTATDELRHFNEMYMELNDNVILFNEVYTKDQLEAMNALIITYSAITIALSEYIAELEELTEAGVAGEQAKTINSVTEEIKKLQKELGLVAIDNIAERMRIEQEINNRKELIKTIDAQTKAHEKLRKELAKIVQVQEEGEIALEAWMVTIPKTATQEVAALLDTAFDFEQFEKNVHDDRLLETEEEARKRVEAEAQKRAAIDLTFNTISNSLDILAQRQEANLQAELARVGDNEEEKARVLADFAKREQRLAISRTIISGAEGIVKIPTAIPYPAAIPFQIALALQTLAQIGIIRGQKFERGGYDVLSGRRHAQGGIQIPIGEGEDGEGHAVFSRQATQKYGKFLPAFVKAINENKTDITEGGSYNFNFDDSKSVNELKGIRKLLSKEEISYEGGYRIITRNGQRTKVKI